MLGDVKNCDENALFGPKIKFLEWDIIGWNTYDDLALPMSCWRPIGHGNTVHIPMMYG